MKDIWALSASPAALMRGQENFILSGVLPSVKSVKWGEPGSGAHTTGKVITLPAPFLGMTPTDLLIWRYICQHEMGHESKCNASPHWAKVMEKERPKKPFPLLWTVVNVLSDYSQEKNCLGEYDGRDQILLEGRATWAKCVNKPRDMDKGATTLTVTDMLLGLAIHDCQKRKGWNSHISDELTMHWLNPKWEKAVNACGDWDGMHNERDVYELGCEIYALFKEHDPAVAAAEAQAVGTNAVAAETKSIADAIKSRVVSPHWVPSEEGLAAVEKDVAKTYNSEGRCTVIPARHVLKPRRPICVPWKGGN